MSSHAPSRAALALLLGATVGLAAAVPDLPLDAAARICAPRIPAPLQRHGRFGCPLALDAAAAAATARGSPWWSPWTHAPQCVNATVTAGADERSGQRAEPTAAAQGSAVPVRPLALCVYTNTRHGLGGISVVTTPEAAASAIDLLDEELPVLPVLPGANAAGPRPAYRIVDLPGRGKGVVAARAIAQYEAFMVDYAALVVDLQVAGPGVPRAAGYRLLDAAADQLDPPSAARVRALAQTSTAARNAVENVLRSNAFHTVLTAAGADHMALFPEVAVSPFGPGPAAGR